MKRISGLVLTIVLCVVLVACNNWSNGGVEKTLVPDSSAESDKPVDDPEMYAAYFTALEKLIRDYIFPDGSDRSHDRGNDMSENKFAVYDVDNDGKEELIILYSATYSAAMSGCVFGYDSETGTLQTELREFPLMTFYDNGIIKVLLSHNQGLAGEFWPYSLYQYSTDSDSYEKVGMVDAWDRNLMEVDYHDNPFPSEIDKSGTGFVYYIMEDGQNYDNSHPLDASEYNKWIDSFIGGASEMDIGFLDLTKENVSRVGSVGQ